MRFKVFLVLFFASSLNLFAQITNQQSNQQTNPSGSINNSNMKVNSDSQDLLSQLYMQNMQNTSQYRTFPVDKAVNPDLYIVGPNDIFNLGLVGYLNQIISLVVNLEGSIVIPSVGEIKVGGLTLSEARSKVVKAVKSRYYSSDVSFTLTTPRNFLISVSSLVQKKYEVSPLTRPSSIIYYVIYDSLDISRTQYKAHNFKDNSISTEFSLRNIEIIRKDGSISNVDLYKYFMTNDDRYNSYFREGDILRIPFGQLSKNYITIEGAVQLSGIYEYNKNDDLETIIGLGRGFDKDAEPDSISIFRVDQSTNKYESVNLSYENNKNFKIDVFDRIFVKYKTNYIKSISVTLLGEVNRPGVYPITFKNTTLKDVIEMAGGFKSTAYLPLCIVFRKYDEEYLKRDTNEILVNMRANDLIISDKDKSAFERDIISRRNRVVVDFEKLFKGNDETQNIILEDKDIVYINDDKKTVYVFGQVSNEGYVPYKQGADFQYYIDRAGGYSLAADEGNTRIIKFNSRGWYKPEKVQVMSGDFVYVPKKTPAEFKESLLIIATIIGTITAIVTTYLLIKQNN